MANDNITLIKGLEAMENSLDVADAEQRKIAHGALDKDNWSIVAAAQKNIDRIKEFRAKFDDLKNTVLSTDLVSELGALGVELPTNSAVNGSGAAPKEPADEPEPADETRSETQAEAQPDTQPEPAAEPEPTASGFSIVDACEELIAQYPFAMMTCYSESSVSGCVAADDASAMDMKNPEQLSNGIWVDTGVSEERAKEIVNALRTYCGQQKG